MQVGAVFGMIFAIIVMGFVLFFGADQIANIMCIGNIGQTTKAVKNLETLVDDVQASGEGSSDTFKVSIAKNAKLCFIDPDDPRPHLTGNWMPDPELYPVIRERIQTGGYNVWIEYNCGNTDPGHIMDYVVTASPGQLGNFCVESGNTLLLTNIGIEVMVEKLPV